MRKKTISERNKEEFHINFIFFDSRSDLIQNNQYTKKLLASKMESNFIYVSFFHKLHLLISIANYQFYYHLLIPALI